MDKRNKITRDEAIEVLKSITDARVRTIDSFRMGETVTVNASRLLVDEALMVHQGAIYGLAIKYGVGLIICIGDVLQIPWINLTVLEIRYSDLRKLVVSKAYLVNSYRCTLSTAYLLNPLYRKYTPGGRGGMYARSEVVKDVSVYVTATWSGRLKKILAGLKDKKVHILTFLKSDAALVKNEMRGWGVGVNTINENQGKECDHIILIRTRIAVADIYKCEAQQLVAVSRHTKTFTYISATQDELASKLRTLMITPQSALRTAQMTQGGYVTTLVDSVKVRPCQLTDRTVS